MAHIAIVEDNPDNRDLLCVLLEDHDLIEFPDGPSALEGLADVRPDLVLLDISLPGMDGVEVLTRLRQIHPNLPAIALTAHAMRGDRERLLGEGFNQYVSKPIIDEDLLFDAIAELLP